MSENLPYFPMYLIRVNLHDRKKEVIDFFENDEIAILVDQDDEIKYWDYISNNSSSNVKPKQIQFINRWFTLTKLLSESDVLIIAKYLYEKEISKIGIIKKNTKIEERSGGFKVLKISHAKPLKNTKFPILNSIIPHQVTLSPIKQREELIHYLFSENYKKPEISVKNISPNLIELLCLEWLRSNIISEKYKKYRIKYQYLRMGGNYADVDIFGKTYDNQKIACQITSTKDKKLLEQKLEKLSSFESDIKILFCNENSFIKKGVEIISIDDVWEELSKDTDYKNLLEFLINN